MKTVYVVTSSGRDIYTAMTRISVASLRQTNPGVQTVVACDAETDKALRQGQDPLLGEVDDWLVVETPSESPVFRNRFIKTSLRSRIDGPYLYLDSDTVIRDDLSAIFSVPGDVGGAPNHSRGMYAHQISGIDQAILKQMGWSTSPSVYVNGGALYASESDGAHRFYRLWHEKWLESYRRRQDYRDQPALNSAIWEAPATCSILPHRYNAQIVHAPETAQDAAIWHYYSAKKRDGYNNVDAFIQRSVGAARLAPEHSLTQLMSERICWKRSFWGTEYGRMAIRSAAQERLQAFSSGAPEAGDIDPLLAADSRYARAVIVKVAVDAYWSGLPDVYRQARKILWRHFPAEIVNRPVRQCVMHDLGRRLRGGGEEPSAPPRV